LFKTVKRGKIWLCNCECGNTKTAVTAELNAGNIKSCGCFQRECRDAGNNYRHGGRHTAEYNIWNLMRDRCVNPKSAAYSDYGGRGISVCERWNSFVGFIEDMGKRPSSKHTIDRVDNNGNYCAENCEWRTRLHQSRNRRNVRMLAFRGEIMCLSEWCEKLKIDYSATRQKLKRRNWSMDALHADNGLLTAPPGYESRCTIKR
jgi:hypothetical protein